jgi:class 3 adenylate cyclase
MELPAQRDDVVSTLRQLELLCTSKKLNSSFLDILKLSPVVHYWGEALDVKELDGLTTKDHAILIKKEVQRKLLEIKPISLFGNLNPGLDLLVAEVALSQGVELNIVIPHPMEIYLSSLEKKLPQDWADRTRSCLERATNVEVVDTQRDGCFSDVERLFATRVAMGKALLRARAIGSDAIHLSFGSNLGSPSAPLSSDPCNEWTATGRTGLRVKTPQFCRPRTVCRASPKWHNEIKVESPVERVFLFADVKGFSSLGDRQMPNFVKQVLGTFRAVQDQIGDAGIEFKNTWGDGVFLVFSDVGQAARYALTCQQNFRDLKNQTKDLPEEISVRIGLHAGTAWRLKEPITSKENYFGNAVSKAARIEPVTHEGQLFASEQCAALLELSPESHIVAEYVGQVETPKGFGVHPLYKLVRNFSG